MRTGGIHSQAVKAEIDNAMILSVAEETRNTALVDDNRACSDGECRKNKCSGSEGIRTRDRTTKKGPLCNGCGQGEKLLCLWRIQAHGPTL